MRVPSARMRTGERRPKDQKGGHIKIVTTVVAWWSQGGGAAGGQLAGNGCKD